jgi:hypothetical protein
MIFMIITVCLHWLPAIGSQLRVRETIGLGTHMAKPLHGHCRETDEPWNGMEWGTQIEDALSF